MRVKDSQRGVREESRGGQRGINESQGQSERSQRVINESQGQSERGQGPHSQDISVKTNQSRHTKITGKVAHSFGHEGLILVEDSHDCVGVIFPVILPNELIIVLA